jgi:hypothetical protein
MTLYASAFSAIGAASTREVALAGLGAFASDELADRMLFWRGNAPLPPMLHTEPAVAALCRFSLLPWERRETEEARLDLSDCDE